jgi:hypothetical protein
MSTTPYDEELKEREIRQRKWEAVVSAAIAEVETALLKQCPGFHHTTFFGAMGIDPRHLAIWCFFKRDADLGEAEESGFTGRVQEAIRTALGRYGYPVPLIQSLFVSFATDEDVQRTCAGNYWHYLK